ncbi:hypothetical protein F5Y12DRAFT_714317 [Xylaria sp. FL1777]|nr:hypothetical protein F5Y12DRAFT_714317 [Xylaria sp. FL1777]
MRAHIQDERRGWGGKSEPFIAQMHMILRGSSMKALDMGRLRAIAIVGFLLLGRANTPALFALHMHRGALSIGAEPKVARDQSLDVEQSASCVGVAPRFCGRRWAKGVRDVHERSIYGHNQ